MIKRVLYFITFLLIFISFYSCEHSKKISQASRTVVQDNTAQTDYAFHENLVYYTDSALIDSMAHTVFAQFQRTDWSGYILPYLDSIATVRSIPDSLFFQPENYSFLEMVDIHGRSYPFTEMEFLVKPTGVLQEYIDEEIILSALDGRSVIPTTLDERSVAPTTDYPYYVEVKLKDEINIFSQRYKQFIRNMKKQGVNK